MLLAIDCGNTNTVFTLFESEIKLSEWRLETVLRRPADEYFIALCHVLESQKLHYTDIKNCILASVVPVVTHHLVRFCEERLALTPMVIGEEGVKLNLDVQTDDPAQVGADRLVNAVAVAAAGDVPAIILDFGTATTFDVLIGNTYFGGIIAPGVRLSLNTLSDKATLIPKIDLKKINKVIGNNTISAVRSGFFWGYAGLIDNIINLIKKETRKSFKVIITGGFSNLFKNSIKKTKASHNQDITIKGLIKISKLI